MCSLQLSAPPPLPLSTLSLSLSFSLSRSFFSHRLERRVYVRIRSTVNAFIKPREHRASGNERAMSARSYQWRSLNFYVGTYGRQHYRVRYLLSTLHPSRGHSRRPRVSPSVTIVLAHVNTNTRGVICAELKYVLAFTHSLQTVKIQIRSAYFYGAFHAKLKAPRVRERE
ncbi:hypothetical protein PUN28_013567 [Cardiocondyla obscurior]|uniref:Secreted protein n=1 Tax=Cardiocondyla obscurior TaxID=286306 RepID=A0AAW2F3K8_9HYME